MVSCNLRETPTPPRRILDETQSSTIARSKEASLSTRLCELMNRPAASSRAHVVVERRPGDVPVLPWTKSHRIPSTNLGNLTDPPPPNQYPRSRASILPLGDKLQWHIKKQISLDLKNGEKTKLPIWRINKEHVDFNSKTSPWRLQRVWE
jgi:hypothetical protein